jgi:hypothetical protein
MVGDWYKAGRNAVIVLSSTILAARVSSRDFQIEVAESRNVTDGLCGRPRECTCALNDGVPTAFAQMRYLRGKKRSPCGRSVGVLRRLAWYVIPW